jgi:hypothetical protein
MQWAYYQADNYLMPLGTGPINEKTLLFVPLYTE